MHAASSSFLPRFSLLSSPNSNNAASTRSITAGQNWSSIWVKSSALVLIFALVVSVSLKTSVSRCGCYCTSVVLSPGGWWSMVLITAGSGCLPHLSNSILLHISPLPLLFLDTSHSMWQQDSDHHRFRPVNQDSVSGSRNAESSQIPVTTISLSLSLSLFLSL